MASNSKTSVTKAQNEQHKKILSQLLKLDGNRRCCDCFARGPTWASVNLGLFVCLNCSGIHRSLGTHLSKVRSTTLDTWLPEQVEFVSKLGNVRANRYWEATLPAGHRRPTEGDMSGLKVFITDKYQNQKFVSRDYDSPPNIDNYLDHPFMRQTDASQAASPPAASGQMPEKAAKAEASSSSLASLGQRATSPVPAAAPDKSAAAVRRPTPPPTATAQVVPAAPQMMDLLSLEDSTASPIAQPSQPAADNNDGDWAAFMTASGPQATASDAPAAPTNGSAAPAVLSHDSSWDAFQSGDVAPSSLTAATAAFDPFGSSHATEAALLPQNAQLTPAPAARTPVKHVPQRSADDIMKMFDTPQQNAFAQLPAQGHTGFGHQQAGAFGGQQQNGMVQGAMYGMNPQQMAQLQQMYAAQGMQLSGLQQGTFNAFPMSSSTAGAWGSQQSAMPSFTGFPQQSGMTAPSKLP